MKTNHAAFGIYRANEQVEVAIQTLSTRGFNPSNIMVLYPDHPGAQDFAYDLQTSVRKGAVIGALFGAAVAAFIGYIAFDTIGGVVFGGLFGAFFGGGAGALVGIGTPEKPGNRYIQYIKDGGILLSVHVDEASDALAAEKILENTGAEDVTTTDETKAWRTVIRNSKPIDFSKLVIPH